MFAALGACVFLPEATTRLRAVAPEAMTAGDERRAHAGLTPRQLQILREVSRGHTDKQIARDIGLSHRTVEMHVQRLMTTLHCRTRAEAVAHGRAIVATHLQRHPGARAADVAKLLRGDAPPFVAGRTRVMESLRELGMP